MLTLERLREVLSYDPDTGLLTWRQTLSRRAVAGKVAGSLDNNGYIVVRIDRRIYKSHRLAWLLMMGAWPRATIDHINGAPADNRWENLREATYSQNNANRPKAKKSREGLKGVYPNGRKWVAHFRNKYIGTFDTPEEASAAYVSAAKAQFGDFFNGGR